MLNILTFILSSALSFALHSPNHPISIQKGDLTIHGQRFLNADGNINAGERVLFTHGLTSNFHEFERAGDLLVKNGFNPHGFNFRGHGNGNERSVLSKYNSGDYGFDKMVEVDFPAMVDYVSEGGKYPITVIGHSMGGMIPRASIAAGFVDPKLISKIVLIGSPSTFDQTSLPMEILSRFTLLELPLWLGVGERPLFGSGLLSLGADLIALAGNPIVDWLSRSVVRRENFGEKDRWQALARSHHTPKDILRSFANFRSNRFKYEDAALPVPVLHIMGSDDGLAPWREIVRKGLVQSKDSQALFLLMEKVSHVDLVAEKPLAAYADVLLSFLKSPQSFDVKHGFLRRSLSCESALAN